MTDRTELLEAALDGLPEGLGLLGGKGEVMFWNQAAQGITGYPAIELLGRPLPEGLEPLFESAFGSDHRGPMGSQPENHRAVKQTRHRLGHMLPVITTNRVLLNGVGERIGSAVLFHPVESRDALPLSETPEASSTEGARADLLERLQIEYDDFRRGGAPLSILRLTVDQALELRKTHGAPACHAMLEKVYYAVAHGLRPGEEIGYWSNDGFLVIAHERNVDMLASHADTLVGLARTADFRWWGDRISLTVSIGAAQVAVDACDTLTHALRRAREAMENSIREGGNRAAVAPPCGQPEPAQEDSPCLPS